MRGRLDVSWAVIVQLGIAVWFAGGTDCLAQDLGRDPTSEWSIGELEKALEYDSGVRFPLDLLCTPAFGAEAKLPLWCSYGTIDVLIVDLTTPGVTLLPTLLSQSTNGSWIDPKSNEAIFSYLSIFDWGFEPVLVWQESGRVSSALCAYQDPSELTEPKDLPPLMAATCFLSFPPWEDDELRVKVRFEAIQEVSSTFVPQMSERPFLSQVTEFVYRTYSLGGF